MEFSVCGVGTRSDTGSKIGEIDAVNQEPFVAWIHHPLARRRANRSRSAALPAADAVIHPMRYDTGVIKTSRIYIERQGPAVEAGFSNQIGLEDLDRQGSALGAGAVR